ncbi:glycosyltransferase family 2 protein [bacterium]|nr:glycosyltransferase family 2 protein [bacterium]
MPPLLSIVTTVYDRADCLLSCVESVRNLHVRDYEHLIVADHPPSDAFARLESVVSAAHDPRCILFNLPERFNNFGIAPAEFGVRKAGGKYLAFLDDDNAFLPHHFDALIDSLDRNLDLGFVFGVGLWNNERILNDPVPAKGGIDLGQALFRRDLFRSLLNDSLNYSGYEWDWDLIHELMSRGVRYRFIDQETFVFRLKSYPHFPPDSPVARANRRIEELSAEKTRLEADAASLTTRCADLSRNVDAARDEIHLLRSSTCWRMTAPLRAVMDCIRRAFPHRP